MVMRDLLKDLKLCNQASPGSWVTAGKMVRHTQDASEGPCRQDICNCLSCWPRGNKKWDAQAKANAVFIAEARDGWPHAIERALKAEAEVERLKKREEALLELIGNVDWNSCPPGSCAERCKAYPTCGACVTAYLDSLEEGEHDS
jgi:hypothetical protein